MAAPNVILLLASYLRALERVEGAAFDVLDTRDVSAAANAQLDGLAGLVGLAREDGEADARLRVRFNAQVLINKSQATLEEVYTVITTLAPGASFKVTNHGDASFTVETLTVIDPTIAMQVARAIVRMKAAGVYAFVTWWTANPYFGFAENSDSNALGFDSGGFAFSFSG